MSFGIMFYILGPVYLIVCLPYVTVLNLGIKPRGQIFPDFDAHQIPVKGNVKGLAYL